MGGRSGHRIRQEAARPAVTPVGSAGFPALMAEVAEIVRRYQHPPTKEELQDSLRRIRHLYEELEAEVTPLPARLQPMSESVPKGLDRLDARAGTLTRPPTETWRGLHPAVWVLLARNLHHAAQTGDLDAALDSLRLTVAYYTPKSPEATRPKGRPPTMPLEDVVAAKRLRDQGLSYGRISKKLNHPASRIGSALRHHYPQKKSR